MDKKNSMTRSYQALLVQQIMNAYKWKSTNYRDIGPSIIDVGRNIVERHGQDIDKGNTEKEFEKNID